MTDAAARGGASPAMVEDAGSDTVQVTAGLEPCGVPCPAADMPLIENAVWVEHILSDPDGVAAMRQGAAALLSRLRVAMGADVERLALVGGLAVDGTGGVANDLMPGHGAGRRRGLDGSDRPWGGDRRRGPDGEDLLDGEAAPTLSATGRASTR